MFENAYTGFDYSARGTCFLCSYAEAMFVITARHVLDRFDLSQLLVPRSYASREFLRLEAGWRIDPDDEEDADWADLLAFKLAEEFDAPIDDAEHPFALTEQNAGLDDRDGGKLVFRGFPLYACRIDYDRKAINRQAHVFGAILLGASQMAHCYELEFNDLSKCEDIDGLSGSPVFLINTKPPYEPNLAGILIRGSKKSGRGHFIDGRVVLRVLQRLTEAVG